MNKERYIRYALTAAIAIFWTTAACVGLYNLAHAPAVPEILQDRAGHLSILTDSGDAPADTINVTMVSQQAVTQRWEVKYLLDRYKAGDSLLIQLADGSRMATVLDPVYSRPALISKGLAAAIFLLISIILGIWHRHQGERFFSISCAIFGFILASDWPGFYSSINISLPLSIIFIISYPQAAIAFLLFSYQYPFETLTRAQFHFRKTALQYGGITLSVILLSLYFLHLFQTTPDTLRSFVIAWKSIGWVFIALIIAGLARMFTNAKQTINPAAQIRLSWVFAGFFWGIFPVWMVSYLPQWLGAPPLLPEWTHGLSFALVPLCIAIGILSFRVFSIEILLRITLLYGALFATMMLIYIGLQKLFSLQGGWIGGLHPALIPAAALLISTLLFLPARSFIQRFLRRHFFDANWRFRQAKKILDHKLFLCTARSEMLRQTRETLETIIPMQMQLFLLETGNGWQPGNGVLDEHHSEELLKWTTERSNTESSEIFINAGRLVMYEDGISATAANLPDPWMLGVSVSKDVLWCVSGKKSGETFWQEDVMVIEEMARRLNERLDWLQRLQEAAAAEVEVN